MKREAKGSGPTLKPVLSARPGLQGPSPATRAFVLWSFLGFQAMDALTTHVGLQLHHQELNRLMAPLMALHGELAAYAVKGVAIAILLAVLMLLKSRPYVWRAFRIAAWVGAIAVVANVTQLIS
jgi:hypothetical protein